MQSGCEFSCTSLQPLLKRVCRPADIGLGSLSMHLQQSVESTRGKFRDDLASFDVIVRALSHVCAANDTDCVVVYSALENEGMLRGDRMLFRSIADGFVALHTPCCFPVVASRRSGNFCRRRRPIFSFFPSHTKPPETGSKSI